MPSFRRACSCEFWIGKKIEMRNNLEKFEMNGIKITAERATPGVLVFLSYRHLSVAASQVDLAEHPFSRKPIQ